MHHQHRLGKSGGVEVAPHVQIHVRSMQSEDALPVCQISLDKAFHLLVPSELEITLQCGFSVFDRFSVVDRPVVYAHAHPSPYISGQCFLSMSRKLQEDVR